MVQMLETKKYFFAFREDFGTIGQWLQHIFASLYLLQKNNEWTNIYLWFSSHQQLGVFVEYAKI